MDPCVERRVLAMRFIRKAILAPTAIGFATYYLALRFGLTYKPLLVLCGIVVGWPVKISLGVRYEGWRRTRKARALVAVTASESRGKLLCDVDIIQELQQMAKDGFIGEFICLACVAHRTVERNSVRLIGEWFKAQHEKVGSGTFAGLIMGAYFISTSDPGNVKVILTTEFNNFDKGTSDCALMGRSLTVPLLRSLPT